MKDRAIVLGVSGQIGSYMAELLLEKEYDVYGIIRYSTTKKNLDNIRHIKNNINLIEGDVCDSSFLNNTFKTIKPHCVYNFAAQSVAEDCLIPLMLAQKIDYISFKDLWNNIFIKNKDNVRFENINGTITEVIDLPKNKQTRALGYWNGMGTWFPIKQISRHYYKGKIIKLTQKFGSVSVTPNHSIYDIHQNLCSPLENPWLLSVKNINYHRNRPTKKIILNFPKTSIDKNGWIFYSNKSKTSIKKEITDIASFCRFIGAFVAEGHTSYNKANKGHFVGISNNNKKWLEDLQKDLNTFYSGNSCFIKHKKETYKDTWELQINSKILFKYLQKNCGLHAPTKKLPSWFAKISKKHLRILLKKMIEGDGYYKYKNNFSYTSTSYKLMCQVCLILTILNIKYTVYETKHENNDKWNTAWTATKCTYYQPNQADEKRKIEEIDYDGWVYDISVENTENFAVGLGNVVVHNSHVHKSWDIPGQTIEATGTSVLKMLEAIRISGFNSKFFQASTSEMFGKLNNNTELQNEQTPFNPVSIYATAKLMAHNLVKIYRNSYNLFCCSAIIFNTESARRGENFVTKKIVKGAAEIFKNERCFLELGNLDAKRDWQHAKDVVEGIYLQMQHNKPREFVFASGKTHTVQDFVEKVFSKLNLNWQKYIKINSSLFRPTEVDILCGDASDAKNILGWKPKYDLDMIIQEMLDEELKSA